MIPLGKMIKVVVLALVLVKVATAALDTNYVIHQKHAADVDGYFSTPHLIKAKAYWESYKIIDDTIPATISVANQVEFPASSETADVFVPTNYNRRRPVGIYIHMNAGDGAHMPTGYQGSLTSLYCIGASPDHAGNSRHDAWRIARALDLVASLKARYNVDDERIYIGGLSGGALISLMAGMLYPEVFKGVVPTEHIMQQAYWGKAFSSTDLAEMANNGQRWAFIIGADYAPWFFKPYIDTWRASHGFSTLYTEVPGMGHEQPPTAVLEASIRWVDAPVQRQRATTFTAWNSYCYDDSHRASDRGPDDDFDHDSISNGREYALGLDPTTPDPYEPPLVQGMNGKRVVLRYRRSASDLNLLVATSSDLLAWDETGDQVSEVSVTYDSSPFATCEYESNLQGASRMFFKVRDSVEE